MARYHTTAQGNIPFTLSEEVARDAEEAVNAAEQAQTVAAAQKAAQYAAVRAINIKRLLARGKLEEAIKLNGGL